LNVLKPIEIKEFLNEYVIGQDQAKEGVGGGGLQSLQAISAKA
jgi:ATP-dependent protease Clp ATPase subunit